MNASASLPPAVNLQEGLLQALSGLLPSQHHFRCLCSAGAQRDVELEAEHPPTRVEEAPGLHPAPLFHGEQGLLVTVLGVPALSLMLVGGICSVSGFNTLLTFVIQLCCWAGCAVKSTKKEFDLVRLC